jgi:hypothetical protein
MLSLITSFIRLSIFAKESPSHQSDTDVPGGNVHSPHKEGHMGLLDWLFKRKEGMDQGHAAQSAAAPDERFIDVPSRRFFGPSSSSPSGRYRIAWNGGHGTETGKTRRSGQYLLLDGQAVVAEGKMTRPMHGAVANNGTFILADAKQNADLSGALCAFDIHGKRIMLRNFKANIFNCGISGDGRLAACQTCNSPDENDSSILAIFDLTEGRELAAWIPESGWPADYTFPADGKTIGLGYRGLGTFYYSLTGDFPDRIGWQDACLAKGDYGTAIMMAEGLIKQAGRTMPQELSAKIIASIGRVAPQLVTADKQWQALALKAKGACLEAAGQPRDALSCYEKALALNPKIGVKRRAELLRKAIPQSAA